MSTTAPEQSQEIASLRKSLEDFIAMWNAEKDKPRQRAGIIEFSETFIKLATSLVAARKQFGKIVTSESATITPKDGGRSYSYRYADLPGVLAATAPHLAEHGIVCLQGATTGDNGTLVSIETMLLHESGEWCRTRLSMKATSNTPQGVGSAITYARRYALQSLLGVSPDDDDGKGGSANPPQTQRPREQQQTQRPAEQKPPQQSTAEAAANAAKPAPAPMKNAIRQLIANMNLVEATVMGEATNTVKSSVDDLTAGEGATLLNALQARKRKGDTK